MLKTGHSERTPHQKCPQVQFWFPARMPAPYELPWYGLSKNVKIKKNLRRGPQQKIFKKQIFFKIFIVRSFYLAIGVNGVIKAI